MRNMIAILGLVFFLSTVSIDAQGALAPRVGDFALEASVSSSSSTISALYHVTDFLAIEPGAGFYYYNYADTSSGTTTKYPGTWWYASLGLWLKLIRFDALSIEIGPRGGYYPETYKNEGNSDSLQLTDWWAEVDLRVIAMITKNLGVFTRFGVYYYSHDYKNTTTSYESVETGFGVQSVTLGVTYYFK